MSMFRPMRDELFKYRKRKKRSIDGSMPRVPYTSYRRSRRYVSGLPYRPRGPVHHDLYNWATPREYHPDINAPAAQSEEYWPDKDWGSHVVPHSTNSKLFRPFPELPVPEEHITYEKSKAAGEFFLKAIETIYQSLEEGQEVPSLADIWREHFRDDGPHMADFYEPMTEMPSETAEESALDDVMRRFINIAGALGHLQTVFPEDHPDITNLRDALHEILDDPQAMSKLESLADEIGPSILGTGDPYENDPFEEAEQLFDEQMQSVEIAFNEPMFETPETHSSDIFEEQSEIMFEQLPKEAFPETDNLEQIVQREDSFVASAPAFAEQDPMLAGMMDDMGMPSDIPGLTVFDIDPAIDEINQAMDKVTQQAIPEEMEPDPFQPQDDPYMMGLYEMQYMANPFGTPGSYEPMGPLPGPMPGP